MLKLGTRDLSALYLGGQEIKKAYLGEELVFDTVSTPTYTITATIDPAGSGTVAGPGQYKEGETCTLAATVADGYKFAGWQENGQTVSTDASYSFTATANRNFTAAFEVEADIVLMNWQTSILPYSATWNDMCYGDGVFVVITNNAVSNKEVIYSPDGIAWTAATTTHVTNSPANGIAYGDGGFIAIDTKYLKRSSNGVSWSNSGQNLANILKNSIAYGENVFAATTGGTTFYYSNKGSSATNTSNWWYGTLPSAANRVVYGDSKFVFISTAASGNVVSYWIWGNAPEQATLPVSAKWGDLTYGGDKFVAVSNGSNSAVYSTDGITWNATTLPASDNWVSVAYGDGKFVAIASNSSKVAYSEDGVSWSLTGDALPSALNWKKIVFGGNKFVAIANGSTTAVYATI